MLACAGSELRACILTGGLHYAIVGAGRAATYCNRNGREKTAR